MSSVHIPLIFISKLNVNCILQISVELNFLFKVPEARKVCFPYLTFLIGYGAGSQMLTCQ